MGNSIDNENNKIALGYTQSNSEHQTIITDEKYKGYYNYIGDDGKPYPTLQALEQANKAYWDNLTPKKDLSHLRALDGSYHSSKEGVQEANRRYREKMIEQQKSNEAQKYKLLQLLFENPDYALDCAGLSFFKQVHQIDPKLAQETLSLLLQASKDDDFENLKVNYMHLLANKMNMQDAIEKTK